MTHHPTTLQEAFASLRRAAQADAAAHARTPSSVEMVLFALLIRLLGQLERMARAWQQPAPRPAARSRSHARIASGLVPPRGERPEQVPDWWFRMNFGRGMRPAAPPPRTRILRIPPPEPAPA